jgi:hypothetical protein
MKSLAWRQKKSPDMGDVRAKNMEKGLKTLTKTVERRKPT